LARGADGGGGRAKVSCRRQERRRAFYCYNNIVHYVYILKLRDGQPYVGSTSNLKQRLEEHEEGKSPATKRYLPCELVSYICFKDRLTSMRFERHLKTGSGRAFRKRHFGI